MCRQSVEKSEISMHFQTCQYQQCPQCQVRIAAENYHLHLQSCALVYCRPCRTRVALDNLSNHRLVCAPADFYERNYNHLPPMSDTLVTKNILASTTKFPALRGMKLTMEAWLKYPLRTIVADFEYMSGTGLPPLPIQVAIANASGEWIIPVTTINHEISKRELLEWGGGNLKVANRVRLEKMIVKYYGADDMDETTKGLTWGEIAGLIDNYIQV